MTSIFTDYKIRKLQIDDYDKEYLNLLSQLTTVGTINKTEFIKRFNELPKNHKLFIIEKESNGDIVAIGSLIIEFKFIHECGKVGHIEDIVVNENYRKRDLGKMIINYLTNLSKKLGCYKCILNCSDYYKEFYVKCGYKYTGCEMSAYHK